MQTLLNQCLSLLYIIHVHITEATHPQATASNILAYKQIPQAKWKMKKWKE